MSMIDKYDTLQDQLGIQIRELNEYKYNNQIEKEIAIDSNELMKEKLKELGWGNYEIVGYFSGYKKYKVKLKNKSHFITILTLDKQYNIMHIMQDKTGRLK